MGTTRGRGAKWRRWLLIVAAVVVINLPWVAGAWRQHQVTTDGIHVTATIKAARVAGDDVLIDLTFPESIDPGQTVRKAKVDRQTFDEVRLSRQIGARVLQDDPAAFRVDGEIRSRIGGIVTLVGDAFVVFIVLLGFRLGGRIRRPALVAIALGDVAEGGPESVLDKQPDGSYLICGEVREARDGSIVLALRDRDVTVHLQGYANPVAPAAPAQVRAELVG